MQGMKGKHMSFANIMMELKKCCNHSLLIREPESQDDDEKDRLEVSIENVATDIEFIFLFEVNIEQENIVTEYCYLSF